MIPLTLYKNKSVGVFGLGKAGQATVAALRAGGAEVFAWDDNPSAPGRTGDYREWPWDTLSAFVPAPGLSLSHPAVEMAEKHGIEIVGDIELLWRQCPDATYVGITGTNGKSTTTTLIAHILKGAGRNVEVGGNLGTAALSLAPLGKGGIYVLEASSYQLDLVSKARFNVGVLLNITPDHLDRHGTMENYIAAKMHVFDRQTKDDTAVIAVDDDYTRKVPSALCLVPRNIVEVSSQRPLSDGVYVESAVLHDATNHNALGTRHFIDLSSVVSLTGRHNWQNAAASYAACRTLGLAPQEIEKGLKSFAGLAHRMEFIADVSGVRFINDSKATNAEATANALEPYDNIYWILGGKPKEGGIESLTRYFPKIAHAFLIGQAANEFARTLKGKVSYTQCGTLAVAFEKAAAMALTEKKAGAVVLLSPACASWDQWKNFEERGDAFRAMVKALHR